MYHLRSFFGFYDKWGALVRAWAETYGLPEVNLSHGDTLGDMWDSIPVGINFATNAHSGGHWPQWYDHTS